MKNMTGGQAIEAAHRLKEFCSKHKDCNNCPFDDSGVYESHCMINVSLTWKKREVEKSSDSFYKDKGVSADTRNFLLGLYSDESDENFGIF